MLGLKESALKLSLIYSETYYFSESFKSALVSGDLISTESRFGLLLGLFIDVDSGLALEGWSRIIRVILSWMFSLLSFDRN